MNLPEFHPGLLLIAGALLVPLLSLRVRRAWVIVLPALACALIAVLPDGEHMKLRVMAGFPELTLLRVDKLSKAFGYVFTINAVAAFIFAYYVKQRGQHTAALVYIGGSLGAVFAGDLISLWIFWEIMAVSSTFVILARGTATASGAAFRYLFIHLLGGLFFVAGIAMVYQATGTLAFHGFDSANATGGEWLILAGFLVNAAAPPLSAWLSDAYPEASVTGGVLLSAYTTKTAVYALLRGFPGWEILMVIGCAMTVYGIIYALLENDMRRILAYSIINQVGFMVCATGIGTETAINGATAHAFCHIIYKSLLWMSAGAVLYRVGKSKCTELGGLYKTMPWTMILGTIGALAISSVPLTSGFTSKTMIVYEAKHLHLTWVWLLLSAASAGVFLHAGIKFPYFVFFNQDRGLRPKEAPNSMLLAMGILAFLCIYLGCRPGPLYAILPYEVNYEAYTASHVVTKMQLLILSALVFFLCLKWLRRTDTVSLDTDWFYRKGAPVLVRGLDKGLNGLNTAAHRVFVTGFTNKVVKFFSAAPASIAVTFMSIVWASSGTNQDSLQQKRDDLYNKVRLGTFPVGMTAFFAVVILALLFLFSFRAAE